MLEYHFDLVLDLPHTLLGLSRYFVLMDTLPVKFQSFEAFFFFFGVYTPDQPKVMRRQSLEAIRVRVTDL